MGTYPSESSSRLKTESSSESMVSVSLTRELSGNRKATEDFGRTKRTVDEAPDEGDAKGLKARGNEVIETAREQCRK